jgi:hypothetical protein
MSTMTRLFTAALVLTIASPVMGAETTGRGVASEPGEAWDTGRASGDIPFPEFRWMSGDNDQIVKADGLLGPKLDTLGPFLLQPNTPATRFSARGGFEPQSR